MSARVPHREFHALQQRIVACRQCPRLVQYIAGIHKQFPTYWCQPVPAFGDADARIILLGLAPGRYGSNRTGRMFTGDASGSFLFPTLHRSGLCSQPDATDRHDGLQLHGVLITAAARCAPPQNKPTREELRRCGGYLAEEFALLPKVRVVVALGKIAHDAYLRLRRRKLAAHPFQHGAMYEWPGEPVLLDTYHPSRQNTNTGKLTRPMFEAVFRRAKQLSGL